MFEIIQGNVRDSLWGTIAEFVAEHEPTRSFQGKDIKIMSVKIVLERSGGKQKTMAYMKMLMNFKIKER